MNKWRKKGSKDWASKVRFGSGTSAHSGEDARFSACQFDPAFGRPQQPRLSGVAFNAIAADKSLAWHVEKCVIGAYGLWLSQDEAGWPW